MRRSCATSCLKRPRPSPQVGTRVRVKKSGLAGTVRFVGQVRAEAKASTALRPQRTERKQAAGPRAPKCGFLSVGDPRGCAFGVWDSAEIEIVLLFSHPARSQFPPLDHDFNVRAVSGWIQIWSDSLAAT